MKPITTNLDDLSAPEKKVLRLLADRGMVRAGEVSSAAGSKSTTELQTLILGLVNRGVIEPSEILHNINELLWATVVVRPGALPNINQALRTTA